LGTDEDNAAWSGIYRAPFDGSLTADLEAEDSDGRKALDLLPGDVVLVDQSLSEEFCGKYEIGKLTFSFPSAADSQSELSSGSIDLELHEYNEAAFENQAGPLAGSVDAVPAVKKLRAPGMVDANGNVYIDYANDVGGSAKPENNATITVAGIETARNAIT
jgi:hypothetical protein